MFIRFAATAGAVATSLGLALALSAPAHAQADVMKECGAEYQTAKTANKLGGKSWNEFLAECRVRHAQPAAAKPAAATPAPAPAAAAPAKPAAAAPAAAPAKPAAAAPASAAVFPKAVDPKYAKEPEGKAHMKTCVDQYKANKATNSNGGLKWIQKGGGYWSECAKKLKGA